MIRALRSAYEDYKNNEKIHWIVLLITFLLFLMMIWR